MDFDNGVAYQEMQDEQDIQETIANKPLKMNTDYKSYLKSLSNFDFLSLSIEERDEIKRALDKIADVTHEYDDWIERIYQKMDLLAIIREKSRILTKEEFIDYLFKVNLCNLNDATLDYIGNYLENHLSSLKKERANIGRHRLAIAIAQGLLFVLTGFNNFWALGASVLFFSSILLKFIGDNREYQKYKMLANPLINNIDLTFFTRQISLVPSPEQIGLDPERKVELNIKPQVELETQIEPQRETFSEEQMLVSKINMLESKILLLPKEEEKEFHDRLARALSDFQKSRAIYSACEIQLLLCDKPAEIYTLERKLDAIERDLNSKSLFVTKEDFEIEISKKVETYLTNIGAVPMEDKWQTFGELRSSLLSLLNRDDIVRNLRVSRAFAECFWETYLIASEEDEFAFRDLVCEEFIDAVILEGERILDNLEQDINVITIRSKLNQMKSCCSKVEYLKYLAQDVRLTKKSRKLVRKNSDFHS